MVNVFTPIVFTEDVDWLASELLVVHGKVMFCHLVLTTKRGEVVKVAIIVEPPGHELQGRVRLT